ncbi:MAG: hypothetical protein ACXWLV_07380 [Rhizomicrobium sp.]
MNRTSSAFVRALLPETSCLSLLPASASPALDQPADGVVAAGQASVTNADANFTFIRQTAAKARINWQSFSITAGGTVQFSQPNASSISHTLIGGYLTQVMPAHAGHTVHGIPPGDQNFSSWGDEALWQ